ncbi:MAG: hypothetical protein QW548_02650 [Candidatus Aenigmatarchaeota archaeon]
MAKECFDVETALNDIKKYIRSAATSGKIDKDLTFSLIERTVAILEQISKKIEALEDRIDLIEDKF